MELRFLRWRIILIEVRDKIQQYKGSDQLLIHANHTHVTPNNLLAMYQKYRPDWAEPLKEL